MARLPRIVLPGHPHLVIHRGHGGQTVFSDDEDRRVYLRQLGDSARSAQVEIHGYALLEAEVRLLVTPRTPAGLAELMQSTGRRYVPAFNKRHRRGGTPWEGRFRSAAIEGPRHFIDCLRLVEAPAESLVNGRLDADLARERSSAGHHLGLHVDALVTDHPMFWSLGNTPFEREVAYERLLNQPLADSTLAAILHAALQGWALGSPQFLAMVAQVAGRRARPGLRGRPPKRRGAEGI